MYVQVSSLGHSLQTSSYCTFDFRQSPPAPGQVLQARQSEFWHPGVAVGLERCTCWAMLLPPDSTTLNLRPGSASHSATSLTIFASSPPGVAGMNMGAMYPPLADQLCFFFCFLLLLSSTCHSLGLFNGLVPLSN